MRVVFVGRDRPVWKRILLYLVTFGVSRRIWLYRVNKELDGHDALGLDHRLNAVLLTLPLLGPLIVTAQTAGRTSRMLKGSPVKYGPPTAVWSPCIVPILGNIWFIAWQQSRLNRFWAYEKQHPEHGVEIDVDLSKDPVFRAEIGRALKESYFAGSRFDRKHQRREEAKAARQTHRAHVRQQRDRVRQAGGSTPVLPWKAPARPPRRVLHITCGRCETRFDVTQDPLAETPIVCPECNLTEVIPSLRGDAPETSGPAIVPELKVQCPACQKRFHQVRNLHGPTTITCPACGKTDVLPAGAHDQDAGRAKRRPAKKADSRAKRA